MTSILRQERIRALVFLRLREVLKQSGIDLDPLLRQAGVKPEWLDDEYAWVALDQFATVLTLAAEATGNPCFALNYAGVESFKISPVGYLMASAPDLRTALQSLTRLHGALFTNRTVFIDEENAGRLEFSFGASMVNLIQLTDFHTMRLIARIKLAAGPDWRPVAVGLTHGRPADIAEYVRLLGKRIAFDQPVNSISISKQTLSLPMPEADPQLFKLMIRYCEEQIGGQSPSDELPHRTREAMRHCLERGSVNPKLVADELGMSPRALHAALKSEATSFQRLLDDTRRCLARRYLVESSLKLSDIAARVGYSELSAFTRAARRWFGASPRTLRRNAFDVNAAA